MPKICKNIVAIKNVLEINDIQPEKGKRTTRRTARYLVQLFATIEDPRVKGMVDYPLEYILIIAFFAVLGGANTWAEIEDFGKSKAEWLRKFTAVREYGIPSHDTFRRVFGLIDTHEMQSIIVDLLSANIEQIKSTLGIDIGEYRLVCIDGKEENGTGRKYSAKRGGKIRNTQTLHIYDASNQVCLASEAIDKKTNEIPTAQNLLKVMELGSTLCTFDALHMQRETINIIRGKGGHYVGGLKGNQQGLLEEAASCLPEGLREKLKKSRRKSPVYIRQTEHSHSQKETREYFLVKAPVNEEREQKWNGLRSFILCIKTAEPDNPNSETTTEMRYYASDLDDLSIISDAIRSHWTVEQFHWQLDVSFRGDDNSTMDVTAFDNLSLINKMVLHLIQLLKTKKKQVSVRRCRKQFGWNFEGNLEELVTMFNDEAIIQVLKER